MLNIAAILSGGTGTRAEAGMPKQFVDLGGKPMILRTIDVFEESHDIDQIIVVSHPDYIGKLETMRCEGGYRKWVRTIAGGAERYLSSYEAVKACAGLDGNLFIHDAARPFVTTELIGRLAEALRTAEAAVPVIPLSDTLVEVEGNCIKCVPERKKFRFVQTPQVFRLPLLRKAFEAAFCDSNICVTDDCGLVLNYFPNARIQYVEGDIFNKKLTYHSDIESFNKLFVEKNKK
ncbi:MAG: 2-C-methyl-D-erythritol 4-phosphate cytidylyltransferase [Bacteroidales bacterium]|nr:2-C-methyl-D-erythritol 4-phosphate cytidylyltransferase [Bacteroidales bacterium]